MVNVIPAHHHIQNVHHVLIHHAMLLQIGVTQALTNTLPHHLTENFPVLLAQVMVEQIKVLVQVLLQPVTQTLRVTQTTVNPVLNAIDITLHALLITLHTEILTPDTVVQRHTLQL